MIAALILRRGVNMPFFDEWFTGMSVDVALRAAEGTLEWVDLLAQNFEHRIVFTHLLTAALARTVGWDLRLEMLFSLTLAFASFLALAIILRRQAPEHWYWAIIPISCLMFSVRQQNNWLWGFQTQWYFALFFLSATLAVVSLKPIKLYVLPLAAAGCVCGSFSFGSGLLTWPLISMALWMRGYRTRGQVLSWIFLSGLGVSLFFHQYHWRQRPQLVVTTPMVKNSVLYLFSFLGIPFSSEAPSSPFLPLGAGLLLVFLFFSAVGALWRGRKFDLLAPWLAMGGYGLGSGVMVATSSRGHAWSAPIYSRYVTNASGFAVGTLALLFVAAAAASPELRKRGLWRVQVLVGAGLAAMFVYASVSAWPTPPFVMHRSEAECIHRLLKTDRLSCLGNATADRLRSVEERLPDMARFGFAGIRADEVKPLPSEPSGERVDLEPAREDLWSYSGLEAVTGRHGVFHAGHDCNMSRKSLDLEVHNGDSLTVELRVTERVREREMQVYYTTGPDYPFTEPNSLRIALKRDEQTHRYVIPMTWLQLPAGAHLRGLRIDPVGEQGRGGELEIAGVWLARSST